MQKLSELNPKLRFNHVKMALASQSATPPVAPTPYRGRLAPSPTGYLHLGHAKTFQAAQDRARAAGGKMVLRIEDLDKERCKPEFRQAIIEDLRWFGLLWDEGPDVGGPSAPYVQSERMAYYASVLDRLRASGFIYPCHCSRRDILRTAGAPHAGDEEPHYPGTCRPQKGIRSTPNESNTVAHWRFAAPYGEKLAFQDGALGVQSAVAGKDFGDFIIWRRDGIPAYQLAVVADDSAMQITEVVRGADLLLSTFRQLLLYRALGWKAPAFYHAPLVLDPVTGERLAKRNAAMSLRELRAKGANPADLA